MIISLELNITTDNPKLNDFFYKMKDFPYKEKDANLFASAGRTAGLSEEEINVFFLILGFYKGKKDAEMKLNKKAEQLLTK